jgi:hypothetical protein
LSLEFIYSNDQVSGEWSFQGNPWMSCHTYKTTGYDPNLKRLVFAAHDYDSKRDRLLFFSDADKDKGDATAYDMKTGEAKSLNAADKEIAWRRPDRQG